MSSELDKNNSTGDEAATFDSKNIKNFDGDALFVKVSGSDDRAKKEGKDQAKRRKNAEKVMARALRKQKSAKRRERRKAFRAKLSKIFWTGRKKYITIPVLATILIAIGVFAYNGVLTVVVEHQKEQAAIAEAEQAAAEEEAKKAAEEEEAKNDPTNIKNKLYSDLVEKYTSEPYDVGKAYFEEFIKDYQDDTSMLAGLYLSNASAINAVFGVIKTDEALAYAKTSYDLEKSDESAWLLYQLYESNGEFEESDKYLNEYEENTSDEGGDGKG